MTGAYTRPDGSIMPSTGIWGLRELARRIFVYINERGMLPLTMVHTTSVEILPINAFYTVQYDWEWHFSEGDVQDRFSDEYLHLVTTAEHVGAWPIVLHEQGKSLDDSWTQRTFMGVCMLHELSLDPYVWDIVPVSLTTDTDEARLHQRVRVPILEICQHPDVIVYRYWDDRPQPVTLSHPQVRAIVFSRPGEEAICLVTSYAKEDVTLSLTFDVAKLGLSESAIVTELESKTQCPLQQGSLEFPLRKHDFRALRLQNGE